MVTPRRIAKASRQTVIALWSVMGVSACADVEAPVVEKNPFENIQPEPAPTRRLAHVQVVVRSAAPGPVIVTTAPATPPTKAESSPALLPKAVAKAVTKAVAKADPNGSPEAAKPLPRKLPKKAAVEAAVERAPEPKTPQKAKASAQLDVRGDFAAFRGVEERLVWAFAGVSKPAWSDLQEGECMGVNVATRRVAELPSAETNQQRSREIELLDLGRFEVQLGSDNFEVPLHLAPGVLPYASGVQYRGEQALPKSPSGKPGSYVGGARVQPGTVSLRWQGLSAQLPSTRLQATLPATLNFEIFASDSDTPTWYDLVWSAAPKQGTASTSRLYLHARLPQDSAEASESAPSQVVCRLADRGEWQLDLEELADEGLAIHDLKAPIELELRRVADIQRNAPGFESIKLQLERSERLELLRAP